MDETDVGKKTEAMIPGFIFFATSTGENKGYFEANVYSDNTISIKLPKVSNVTIGFSTSQINFKDMENKDILNFLDNLINDLIEMIGNNTPQKLAHVINVNFTNMPGNIAPEDCFKNA